MRSHWSHLSLSVAVRLPSDSQAVCSTSASSLLPSPPSLPPIPPHSSLPPTPPYPQVFVANPEKPADIAEILAVNKARLIPFLRNFQNEKSASPSQAT